MSWGLAQGMIAGNAQTLAPSASALGPNVYLREQDFLKMLAAAVMVHGLVFFIASLLPSPPVVNIPVRALSFKLGDADSVAAYGSASGVGIRMNAAPIVAPPPVMGSEETWRATPNAVAPVTPAPLAPVAPVKQTVAATSRPVKPQKIIPVVPPPERQVPSENRAPPALEPLPVPEILPPPLVPALPAPQPLSQLPSTAPLTQSAIAPTPQQYVREVGAPSANAGYGTPDGAIGGAGIQNSITTKTIQEIRERYELQISGWIQQHKFYPAAAAGREGRTVVRMRIDRAGTVRYYAIEQSSGVAAIDAAAIDMIRRANPVPAVPENYPAGSLIEFLIPITFKAPR